MADDREATKVKIETSAGAMTVELFPDKAPKHVANFVKLAREGFYDGTLFHRVMKDFMIQGGDPNTRDRPASEWGRGGPGWRVNAEFNDVRHEKGVLSMARSQDPNSAGSQFFICHGDAAFLDGQYTAFGRLCDGLETLDAIATAAVAPGPGGERSKPVSPVAVERMTVLESQ